MNTINLGYFHQFLAELYEPKAGSFQVSLHFNSSFTNIVATAPGLELSDITGFTAYNRNDCIDFLYENRNSLGIWDRSTVYPYHELIDTFQVIRTIVNIGEVSILTLIDINQIVNCLLDYFLMHNSFSLFSQDYSTLSLLHTIISAFDLWDRLPELDIQGLYSTIKKVYYVKESFGVNTFYSLLNININYLFT